MAEPRIVFVMYHELELPGRPLARSEPGYVRYVLSAADFQTQMRWLNQAGWEGVSVGKALSFARDRWVAITFDDGCETDRVVAAEILQELGFSATFYITTGFLSRPGFLSAAQLRELIKMGFEIGCHSMTHSYLTGLDDVGLQREILQAKQQLEQVIGLPVEHFSCPGGIYDRRVAYTARGAGYRSVATSRIRANGTSTDPFALGRVAVMRGTELSRFGSICQARGLWQLRTSHAVRAAARKVVGNSFCDRLRAVALGSRGPQL